MRMLLTLLLVCSFAANAASKEEIKKAFDKRFKIIKDKETGETLGIRAKLITNKFSIKPIIQQYFNDLKGEKERFMWHTQAQYKEINELIKHLEPHKIRRELEMNGIHSMEALDHDYKQSLFDSIEQIKFMDAGKLKRKIANHRIFQEVQGKIQKALLTFDLTMVSNLNDARFFYRKKVIYEIIEFALKQARRIFSEVPVLNAVIQILQHTERLVVEQRLYHQNMLLYYFENLDPEDFGMTKEEVDKAMSSIYEAKINWFNKKESDAAAADWLNYGFNKFYANVRMANKRLRQEQLLKYDKVNKRFNYSFVEAEIQGERKIFNLVDNKHMFSRKTPLAFDFAKPYKVLRMRRILDLAGLGLGFVPINDSIKSIINNFMLSFYKTQKVTEGSLLAHYEVEGNEEMAKILFAQARNPFLR